MELNLETIKSLKKENGDSFYLFDEEQFRTNFIELKNEFKRIYSNFNIAYSYKTNYIPYLCKMVNDLGGYAEVVSSMEVELALKIGVDPSKIIWNGPIKEVEDLRKYLPLGVNVNIDSLKEAKIISKIASSVNKKINVGVRCNYDVGDGVISRFGFDVNGKDFISVLKIINDNSNLHLKCYQCHFANRKLDYFVCRVKEMLNIIDKTGIIPDRIDIGGGIYGKMPDFLKKQFSCDIPKYEDYAKAIKVFNEYFKNKKDKPELVIEPGSALVGDCLSLLCTVKGIKKVKNKYYATVSGSQKNISMNNINPPISIFNTGTKQKEYRSIDIVGFTCIESDVLYKNYNGFLTEGDTVIINNCGSYSIVMKPPFILPNFKVLCINKKEVKVIKRDECFDDIFRTYEF